MRFPEIDIIKGVAVILMVIYHYFYMGHLMNKPIVDINNPMIHAMGIISHSTFIFMVGVNLFISYKKNKKEFYKKQVKRAIKLLLCGGLMTLATYLFYPQAFVRYGIFHFLASAIIISMLFVHNRLLTTYGIVFFTVLSALSQYFTNTFGVLCVNTKNICFNLGLYNYFDSVDHFSFIPYFAYVLLGVRASQFIYKNLKSPIQIPKNRVTNSLATTGKYSLEIYLVHWIIIYLLIISFHPNT